MKDFIIPVCISQTLSKSMNLSSKEDPKIVDVAEIANNDTTPNTPLRLIGILKDLCTQLIENENNFDPHLLAGSKKHLERIKTQCEGWIEDEIAVVKE